MKLQVHIIKLFFPQAPQQSLAKVVQQPRRERAGSRLHYKPTDNASLNQLLSILPETARPNVEVKHYKFGLRVVVGDLCQIRFFIKINMTNSISMTENGNARIRLNVPDIISNQEDEAIKKVYLTRSFDPRGIIKST
jgi:hypothetical protein